MVQNFTRVNEETERARDQAAAQLAGITEMMQRLEAADAGPEQFDVANHGDSGPWQHAKEYEEVREEIVTSALSVEVCTDWHGVGAVDAAKPTHYKILLCWGGPAVQIIGTLDDFNYPDRAQLQYQDWFTEWLDYPLTQEEEETVVKYACEFYFDE
jgi:hypothetical protein